MPPPEPIDGFTWLQARAGRALVCDALAAIAAHLFTTRDWALGSPGDHDSSGSWQEVAGALGVDAPHLLRAHQVHGAAVRVRHARAIQPWSGPGALPRADVLATDDGSVALAVQAADCVPILLADRRTGVVGAVHAGWRGLAARAPQAGVEAMVREFNSRPCDLIVAIGPSISAARYEVGVDVRRRFEAADFPAGRLRRWFSERPANPVQGRRERWLFDGRQSARDQLEASGVPREQIHVAALCTATHEDLFCSYRRDGPSAGRIAAAIRARALEGGGR
jgi:YfiH family protein